jgi:hypothetical protein
MIGTLVQDSWNGETGAQVLLGVELPRVPGDVVAREEPAGCKSCGIAGNAEENKCTDHNALSTA